MGSLHILQIEDSDSDAALIGRLLEGAGYEVEPQRVADARQLRIALQTRDWDAIICDYQFSQLSATEALAIIRDSGFDIPFIVISGLIDEEIVVELMKKGADDYVIKGNLARLVPAIERELKDVVTRRKRREADAALRQSEERLSLALAVSGMGVWAWDLTTKAIYWSAECFTITKHASFDGTLNSFLTIVDPFDIPRLSEVVQTALREESNFAAEFRINTENQVRWLSSLGKLTHDGEGRPSGLIGTVANITSRKVSEEALKQVNQELQEVAANRRSLLSQLHSIREEEWARLARDIHDDLGQSLTTLKIDAHSIERAILRDDRAVALQIVSRSAANVDKLIETVRNIATELRPPLLDRFGLAAALEWQVELLRKQHGLEIEMHLPPNEPALTDLQRITAFRIVQESLTNIIRHARTTTASVALVEDGTSVRLIIGDKGAGFEPSEGLSPSLGILGMRERARLIDGLLSIRRNKEAGTTVELVIPKLAAMGVSPP